MAEPSQDKPNQPPPPLITMPEFGKTVVYSASKPAPPGFSGGKLEVPAAYRTEDLSEDLLLKLAPRLDLNGKPVPSLGGIPMLHKLGQGGMGAVYLGFQPRLRKAVAVKVLPFQLAAMQPTLVRRFIQEAQLAAQVQSPYLVGVLDVNEERGLSYIVMEYVEGESAQVVLKKRTDDGFPGLDEMVAYEIIMAGCQGLAAAHAAGIVHRDLKPDNILIPKLRDTGKLQYQSAKLSDLGLARNEQLNQSLTGSQAGMGTAGFMAPEQAVDAQNAGKPADVYGMAATFYALLAGHPPFFGTEAMRVVLQSINEPAPPIRHFRPDVSHSTGALLERCLAKEPSQRLADGAALFSALQECRANRTMAAINPPVAAKETMTPLPPLASTAPSLALAQPAAIPEDEHPSGLAKLFGFVGQISKIRQYSKAMKRGRRALQESKWSEAEAAFNEALGVQPEDEAAMKGLADSAAGATTTRFNTALLEGRSAIERAAWEEAKSAYRNALRERPEDKEAWAGLQRAEEGYRRELCAAAIADGWKLLGDEQEDSEGHFSHLPEAKRKAVEDCLTRATTLQPEDSAALALRVKLGEPGQIFLDLGNEVKVEMVRVKLGEFQMGSIEAGSRARPHPVKLSKSFYIGKFPITYSQFNRFVRASGYATDAERAHQGWTIFNNHWMEVNNASWKNPGFAQRENYPAVMISWNDAMAFANWAAKNAQVSWAGRQQGLIVALPSEAQWEYAARGANNVTYPWGNSWEGRRANHADLSLEYRHVADVHTSTDNDGYPFASPVGAYENQSWCGAYDMAGNVWEWCYDWYLEDYYNSGESVDPTGPRNGSQRVLRGGSWLDMPIKCRATSRYSGSPHACCANIGFRILVTWQTSGT